MNRPAFTLMELLLVLALLAGTGALVIPMLEGRLGSDTLLSNDAANIADRMRAARQWALDRAAPVCFEATLNGTQARAFLMRSPTEPRHVQLRSDNRFASVKSTSADVNAPQGKTLARILLREDGSSTGGQFKIESATSARLIKVERSTGQVTVEDGI